MKFIKTEIPDVYIIEPLVYGDERGYFVETFNKNKFEDVIGKVSFVQDNESKSSRGVLRGLHFQKPPFSQAKLVRCPVGQVIDVIYDMRTDSPTYNKVVKVPLGGEFKERSVFVPRGCAHGFSVKESALFQYKVDNLYNEIKNKFSFCDITNVGLIKSRGKIIYKIYLKLDRVRNLRKNKKIIFEEIIKVNRMKKFNNNLITIDVDP